jgi:hypothetical protein
MKKTTLAAMLIAAASITFASCKWFSSNKTTPSIVGTWKIDSMHIPTEDTVISPFLYNIGRYKDSLSVQFNADSTLAQVPTKNSITHKYYAREKELIIQEDSTYKTFSFEFKGDSILSLLAKDSAYFLLKRK